MKISVITPTNDPAWLVECWASLRNQTHQDFEWIVLPNNFYPDSDTAARWQGFRFETVDDPRVVRAPMAPSTLKGVGALKRHAFGLGTGDVLLELDHDDMLNPDALMHVVNAFSHDPEIDFAYSDCVDLLEPGGAPTYHGEERLRAWKADGWRFHHMAMDGARLDYPLSFEPRAHNMSSILSAPNHLRAWRRSSYEHIGGHDPKLPVCDDLDLVQRSYLAGKVMRLPSPLYFYRVRGDGRNTWRIHQPKIAMESDRLCAMRLPQLVTREMELRGLPCVDLGGAFNPAGPPWISVDARQVIDPVLPTESWRLPSMFKPDLTKRWPFPDSSIGAFRAFDFLEHLPDKVHTMSEIYRCLAPGGWLLSCTPSALGQGGFQDPTHCSYWVPNSFRYYTEASLGQYIGNVGERAERFMARRLFQTVGEVPYVVADLVSLKGDTGALYGRRLI